MINREKVIKALECRKNAGKRCGNPCEELGMCHYAKAVRGLDGETYRPFVCDREQICSDVLALLKEQDVKQYNNHEVACIIADLFGDPCACNFNDIDTWLPYKCDFRDTCCPEPVGVACWEQYLKYKESR